MAELDKVIKAIECCIDEKHGCYNCEFKYTDGKVACRMFEESYNRIPTELIKDALELLKKQIPMKLHRSGTHTFCARCGTAFGKSADFCPHCGQAVKWE